MNRWVAMLLSGSITVIGCRARPPSPHEPAPVAATVAPPVVVATPPKAASPPPPPPAPATVTAIAVPGDITASIVRPLDGSAPLTVFLPGLCSNANAYLQTFPEAARETGGVVAIEGDQPCGNLAGYRSFSWDAARQDARVRAALAAAGRTEIPPEGITIVGYSQGAALAEQMAARWPTRYTRVVLIGAPTQPSPRSFAQTRGLVTMSCDRDVPARMREAARAATHAGIPSHYIEMPGCTHGNITEGERTLGEAFEWLRANERPQVATEG